MYFVGVIIGVIAGFLLLSGLGSMLFGIPTTYKLQKQKRFIKTPIIAYSRYIFSASTLLTLFAIITRYIILYQDESLSYSYWFVIAAYLLLGFIPAISTTSTNLHEYLQINKDLIK